MTWTDAFRGLPWTATGVGDDPPDAADVLARRARRGGNMVKVPMGLLVGMASRLESQSRALVAAQGGVGAALGPSDLDEYVKAQEEAAERAAAKTGTLVVDGEGDWAGLYLANGLLAAEDHVSNIMNTIAEDGWLVVRLEADGIAIASGSMPTTMGAVQREMGRRV